MSAVNGITSSRRSSRPNPQAESAKRRPFALCTFALSQEFASITQKSTDKTLHGAQGGYCPFYGPKPENNFILTQTEGLMMSGRPKNRLLPGIKMCWWLAAPVPARPVFHKTEPDAAPFFLCSDRSEGHCPGGSAESCSPAVLPGWARTESPYANKKGRSSMSLIRSRL